MSRTFLISYDLGVPETASDYEKVIEHLKSYKHWSRPLQSVWLVVSDYGTTMSIRDRLSSLIDGNDKILVMDVTDDDWATRGIGQNITDWMNRHI